MEKIKVKKVRRVAVPYIVNIMCECGGIFNKANPPEWNHELKALKHICTNCGKEIYPAETYPMSAFFSEDVSEDYGVEEVYIKSEE